ncbi:MAG: dTDP-glucose 4,6-dehydratase [Parcubacteria group bacterium]
MKKRTILITGGYGFMGSDFIRYILSKNDNICIINFDKLTYEANLDNLVSVEKDRRYKFVKGDIADKKAVESVFKKYKPDYIVNFAAETHVDRSIHGEAEKFVRTNVLGVFNILEAVKDNDYVKKFIHISTDEVYGDTPFNSKLKFTEKSPLRPSNPYSSTKASGDMMCLAYYRTYGIPVVITRSGNNYGPYQYPEKMMPFFVLRAFEDKKLPLYGKGLNIRNWVYVRDHSRAVQICLSKGQPGEVYNISADQYKQNKDVALGILKNLKKDKSLIEYVTDRPGHDRRYAPSASKLKRLHWSPEYDFNKGLKVAIKWYEDNPHWVSRVQKKMESINKHIK